jgi:hypothetical protein
MRSMPVHYKGDDSAGIYMNEKATFLFSEFKMRRLRHYYPHYMKEDLFL